MKLAWHNCYSIDKADVVVFGSASGTGSLYHGTEQAPNEIRSASIKWLSGETLRGEKFSLQPSELVTKKIFDAFNIEKKEISEFVHRLAKLKKTPCMIGGDHSNTLEVLKGLSKSYKSISVVYFDAHLDMVSDQGRFYGSVFHDASKIKEVKLNKSACIGCRAMRDIEMKNAKKHKLTVVPATMVEELGVKKVFKKVKKKAGKNIYLSVDIDCVDPGNAPGVSDPVPCGLSPLQVTSLAKQFAASKIIGFDLVEVNPLRDQFNLTVNLGAKLLSEILASLK